MNAFFVHGAYGSPEENWFPWLKNELTKLGIDSIVLQFPTPENQNLDSWMTVFDEHKLKLNSNTIFVGHSIGCAFILNILENIDVEIKASFLVSPFIGSLNNPQFDEINKTFTEKNFNWEKIKQHCKTFQLFASENDPYVPLEKAMDLQKLLNGNLYIEKGAGHFNTDAGYTTFPLLLEKLNQFTHKIYKALFNS